MTLNAMKEMGETGAGLTSADQISAGTELANKWGRLFILYTFYLMTKLTTLCQALISKDIPWFFEMKELIGERPNMIPVGIGNSGSDPDLTVLDGAGEDSDGAHEPLSVRGDPALSTLSVPHKRVLADDSDDESDAPTNMPKALQLAHTSTPASKKVKRSGVESRFADIVKAEESTKQGMLELKKADLQLNQLRIRERAETKREKLRLKKELALAKLQHEREMAELRANMQKQIDEQIAASFARFTPLLPKPVDTFVPPTADFNAESGSSLSHVHFDLV